MPSANDILPPADDGPHASVPAPVRREVAPEPMPEGDLRIASWDLSEAPELMPPPKPVSTQAPSWRTTFGSERRTEREMSTVPASQVMAVDADVVLLQGVSDVAVLRRLFQPRSWRLVVSRRVLSSGDPGTTYFGPALNTVMPVRVTAIAVRARRGLRITGREHILDLARAEDGVGGATPPSATVVRISDRGRALWLLSVAMPEVCSDPKSLACPDEARIAAWRKSRLDAGQETIVGGRFRASRPRAALRTCARQLIETDFPPGVPSLRAEGLPRARAGCVATLELPKR